MSSAHTCTKADKSFGSRFSRHIMAAIQTDMPFAARTPAATVTMLTSKNASFCHSLAVNFGTMAGPANPKAFFRVAGVFWSKFVASFAGRSRFRPFCSFYARIRSPFGVQAIAKAQPRRMSILNSSGFQSRKFGEFSNYILDTIKGQTPRVASVPLLFLLRCPSAVARAITLVIINSVNAVFSGRTWPHVGDELMEAIPLRADSYAPSSISIPLLEVGVVAAPAHALPDAVEGVRCLKRHFSPPFLTHNTAHALCQDEKEA